MARRLQNSAMQIIKNGKPIQSMDDWRSHAPPRSADQWTRGRSALECAAAWLGSTEPSVPPEIAGLLASHADTARLQITTATPDHAVRFDRIRGEPGRCDVAAVATDDGGTVAIGVDARVDERFDGTVEQALADAADRRAHGQRSRVPARVEQLAAALLPPPRRGLPALGGLRYQLLTATAGALAFARDIGAPRAVLIVHEFVTERTEERRRASDYANLSGYVARLSDGAHPAVEAGVLLGPFSVPGEPLFRRPASLYIGKAVRRLR